MSSLISMSDVAKHNTVEDCWLLINNTVYNLSNFIQQHPGGVEVIAAWAGKDGTSAFSTIHSTDVLKMLESHEIIGIINPATIQPIHKQSNSKSADITAVWSAPPVENCLNIADLESICRVKMPKAGLDYYISAADDEITLRENRAAFHRIFLKPRVLVNVKNIDTTTTMLGVKCALPIYISSCALGKLAHPDGECALTRAAGIHSIIQMCPTLGSCSIEEMAAARVNTQQVLWFQLYVNANRATTLSLIKRAEASGMKALCITVDAPVLGRRERDMRNKFASPPPNQLKNKTGNTSAGVARAITQFIDPALSWSDLEWFKANTNLPIFLKGIQTSEDAVLAVEAGVAGIVVSNHGGRQLDCCRSGIEMLVDIMDVLRSKKLDKKMEIYMDGGVRRGSDVFKALAAGATGVGIGRPALYGLGAYGQPGVERAIEIIKEEFIMTMMLMGCPSIKDIPQSAIMTNTLSQHLTTVPEDYLASNNYSPLLLSGKAKL